MAKKQHYVPQFYLSSFTKEQSNQVFVFDKVQHKIRLSNISDVAEENYFYALPKNEILNNSNIDKKQAIEKYFSEEIENEFAFYTKQAIKGAKDKINVFANPIYKKEYSRHLAIQFMRVNRVRNELLRSSDLLQQAFGKFHIKEDIVLDKESSRTIHEKMIFDKKTVSSIAETLNSLTWVLCFNKTNKVFYTSDNPIVTIGHADMGPIISNRGLKCPGIEIAFPLSPNVILLMIDGDYHDCANHDGRFFVNDENEFVDYYNSYQVQEAERIIISCKKDFWLINNMYLKNKNCIDGPKTIMNYGGKDYVAY